MGELALVLTIWIGLWMMTLSPFFIPFAIMLAHSLMMLLGESD